MLTEKGYVYGIWFVAGVGQDLLATVYKADADDKWHVAYRFRYYDPASKDPHDGKDEKTPYHFTSPDGSDKCKDMAIECTKDVIALVEMRFMAKADFVLLECRNDDPKFLFELGSKPWAHIKRLEKA